MTGPRRAAPRGRDRLGRPDPGARRRRAVGEPVAPAGARGRPRPGDPRDDPVRQGQLAPERGHRPRHVLRRTRLRPVPGRRPRDRVVGRRRARRVHRGGDARRLRRGRVAGGPAVVQRRGRDVGDQLRGVHLDPGRQAAAAAPAGDRAGPGHRRPLPDRRPLHRRLRHGQRAEPVRGQPGRDERDAARPGVLGSRLARALARPARGDAAVAHRVAAPAARRAVLAAGLAGPGLRRDRGGRPQRRRLDGFVRRRRACGCRPAAPPRAGRSSATGSTAGRRRRTPARTSTSSTRSSGSSTAG